MLSLPDMFCLVAGVSRRKLCVVFGSYPLGRVGDRGAAGNRGAYVLNSGLPAVRRKLYQRLWLRPKHAVPTQRRTVSRGLVSLYTGQSGGALGSVAFLVAFVDTVLVAGAYWDTTFAVPVLAREVPELVEAGPPGLVMFGSNLSFGLFSLGWLLLGGSAADLYVSARGRRTAYGRAGSGVLPVSLRCHPFRPGGGLDGLELVVREGRTGRATRTRAMRVAQETISPKRSSPVRR